jgi:hypothetical protein
MICQTPLAVPTALALQRFNPSFHILTASWKPDGELERRLAEIPGRTQISIF